MAETGQGASRSSRRGSAGPAARAGRAAAVALPIALVIAVAVAHPGDRLDRAADRVAAGGRPVVPPADADAGSVADAASPVPRPRHRGRRPLPAVTIGRRASTRRSRFRSTSTAFASSIRRRASSGRRSAASRRLRRRLHLGRRQWLVVRLLPPRPGGIGSETASVRDPPRGRSRARRPRGSRSASTISSATPPQSDFYNRFDLELAPDGRTALPRERDAESATDWTIAVEAIDLATGDGRPAASISGA